MVVCRFWQQGNCKFGSRIHTRDSDMKTCSNVWKTHVGTNTSTRTPIPTRMASTIDSLLFKTSLPTNPTRTHEIIIHTEVSSNSINAIYSGLLCYKGDGAHIPFSLDSATIKQDLTTDRPQWILSAYGPGRHAPEQLFGGPAREQSFEEMRLLHYIAAASGNAQPAVCLAI